MHVVRHILLLILVFVLQTTWAHIFELFALKPDLILLVLVYIALRTGQIEATILGFCVGFFQDIHMPNDLGLNALTKSLVGFSVGYGRTGVVADSVQVQVALIFGAVLVHDLIYYLGSSGIGLADVPFSWLRYGLGRALYTCAFGALVSSALVLRRRVFPT